MEMLTSLYRQMRFMQRKKKQQTNKQKKKGSNRKKKRKNVQQQQQQRYAKELCESMLINLSRYVYDVKI